MKNSGGKAADILKRLGRYKFVLLVAAVGGLLMLWPTDRNVSSDTPVLQQSDDAEDELRTMEKDMEAILGKMRGVGRVEVMLTLQSGKEIILASDSTLRYSGNPQNPDNYDRSSETVTVPGGSGGDVVITQERSPQYRGALIVCDGGGNDAVRLRVMEAVSALTGLGSDRIAVVSWEDGAADTEMIEDIGEDFS